MINVIFLLCHVRCHLYEKREIFLAHNNVDIVMKKTQ